MSYHGRHRSKTSLWLQVLVLAAVVGVAVAIGAIVTIGFLR